MRGVLYKYFIADCRGLAPFRTSKTHGILARNSLPDFRSVVIGEALAANRERLNYGGDPSVMATSVFHLNAGSVRDRPRLISYVNGCMMFALQV